MALVVLRRAVAVLELLAAAFIGGFLGIDSLMAPPGGGHVMGDKALQMLAPYTITLGILLAVAAVTAWLGSRRWWAWQAAAVAFGVGVPASVMIYAVFFAA